MGVIVRWLRKVLRVVGFSLATLVGLVVLVALVGLVWLNSGWGKDFVRKQAGEQIPGLELPEIGGFLPFHVVLQEMKVVVPPQQTPLLWVERIESSLHLLPLLRKTIALDLDVRQPRVHVSSLPSGRTSLEEELQRIQAARPEKPEKREKERERETDWKIALDDFTLERGNITWRGAQEDQLQVTGMEIASRLQASQQAGSIELQRFAAQIEQASRSFRVQAEGRASAGERVDGRFIARVLDLSPEGPVVAQAEAHGPLDEVQLQASLQLPADGGRASLQGVADLQARLPDFHLAGSLTGLDPSVLQPGWPAGNVNGHAVADGRGAPLQPGSELRTELVMTPSSLADARLESGRFRLETEERRWRVPILQGQGLGMTVRGRGRGDEQQVDAELHLDSPGNEPAMTLPDGRDVVVRGKLDARAKGTLPQGVQARIDADFPLLQVGDAEVHDTVVDADLGSLPRQPQGRLKLAIDRIIRPPQVLTGIEATVRILEAQLAAALTAALAGREGLRDSPPLQLELTLPLRRSSEEPSVSLAPAGPVAGKLSWLRVPLALLAAQLGMQPTMGGWLDLHGNAAGTVEQPELALDGRVRRAGLQGRHALNGVMKLRSVAERTDASAEATVTGVPLMRLKAMVGAGLATLARGGAPGDRPIELDFTVPDVPVPRLADAAPRLAGWNGRLRSEGRVRGTLALPQAHFETRWRRASFRTRRFGELRTSLDFTSSAERTELGSRATLNEQLLAATQASFAASPGELFGARPGETAFRWTGEMPGYPLELLAVLEPSLARATGKLAGKLDLHGTLARPVGHAELALQQASLAGQRFGTGLLALDLAGRSFKGRARLDQPGGGRVRGRLRLSPDHKLRGRLALHRLELGPLRQLVPDLAQLDGLLDGVATLEGAVQSWEPGRAATEAEAARDRFMALPAKPLLMLRSIDLHDGRLVVRVPPPQPLTQQQAQEQKPAKKPTPLRPGVMLRKVFPFKLTRAQIRDSAVVVLPPGSSPRPMVELGDIEATLENLASRPELLRGAPTVLGARIELKPSGLASGFATADPMARRLTMAGQGKLEGLDLPSLNPWLVPQTGLRVDEGTLDIFTSFKVQQGLIDGGVKVMMKEAEVEAGKGNLLSRLAGLLAGLTLDVFSDQVPGREAAATVVPIRGTLPDPQAQIVPTFLGLLRNAFVIGLAAGLAQLPPVTAEERQGWITQTINALSRRRGPPAAQPQDRWRQAPAAGEREQPGGGR